MSQPSNLSIKVKLNQPSGDSGKRIERVEYLWGRIVIAALCLGAALVALLLLVWPNPVKENAASTERAIASEKVLSQVNALPQEMTEVETQSITKPAPASSPSALDNTSDLYTDKNKAEASIPHELAPLTIEVPANTPPSDIQSSANSTATITTTQQETATITTAQQETAEPALSQAQLLSPQVIQATLSTGIRQRKPTDTLPARVRLEHQEPLRVYFFTSHKQLQNQTLYHNWYYRNKRVASIKSTPKRQYSSAYSYKTIDQYMPGNWQARLETEAGTVLAKVEFSVHR